MVSFRVLASDEYSQQNGPNNLGHADKEGGLQDTCNCIVSMNKGPHYSPFKVRSALKDMEVD